jgi:mRNA interferase RelE/StbE
MARYELRFKPSVARDLRSIHRADVRRILGRIESQRDQPCPPVSEKLSVQERYRVRQGQERTFYKVDDGELIVEVVKVGHRREVRESGYEGEERGGDGTTDKPDTNATNATSEPRSRPDSNGSRGPRMAPQRRQQGLHPGMREGERSRWR